MNIDPEIFTWAGLISLLTLTLMEIVLGIDNIVFISIVADRLPENQQNKGRITGLIIALVLRIGLLFAITWIMKLDKELFTVFNIGFSARDLILIAGGLFLLAKSTSEIHGKLEGEDHDTSKKAKPLSMRSAILQIVLLDAIFSIDSILTAIGIGEHLVIMVVAVVISLIIMMVFAKVVSSFVNKHPTVKMLALSFLLMIGLMLVADGVHKHIPKGYLYFAMAFSLAVEVLNMRTRKKSKPLKLKGRWEQHNIDGGGEDLEDHLNTKN